MAYYIVSKNEMFSFITRAIVAAGAELSHAETLAEVLIAGDYRGHYSHGLNRLGNSIDKYLNEFLISLTLIQKNCT